MKLEQIRMVIPSENWLLQVIFTDGTEGVFDLKPYLQYEAFRSLLSPSEFSKIHNGGYYVEWECGADLSADTLRAHLQQMAQSE